jgi:hypothetical protein
MPVRPIIKAGHKPFAMFKDMWKYSWVLALLVYENEADLIANIDSLVVQPAEEKYRELHSGQ